MKTRIEMLKEMGVSENDATLTGLGSLPQSRRANATSAACTGGASASDAADAAISSVRANAFARDMSASCQAMGGLQCSRTVVVDKAAAARHSSFAGGQAATRPTVAMGSGKV